MFKKAIALLTMVCTVASMSCAALAGTLKVTVHDRESNSLEGADVTATVGGSQAGQYTSTTDSNGEATITIDGSVTDGKVGAGKIGYTSPPAQSFTLGSSETQEITIVLTKEQIDAGKTDAEKVRESTAAITSRMETFTVSNNTTKNDVLNAAQNVVTDDDIRVTVDGFVLKPATADTAGEVRASIGLALNSESSTYKLIKKIAKTGPAPEDKTLADAQTKAAAAVNSMAVSNSTLSDDILKAVQNAVNNAQVTVTWDADHPFNRLAATATAKGRITGDLILSYNNNTAVISIDREIAQLTPSGKYKITMKSTTGGRAYADADTANSGETVSVSAESNAGYTFDYWTASENVTFANKNSQYTRFTMTDKDVTITAHFSKKSSSGSGNDKEGKNDSIYGDGSGSYRDNSSSIRSTASSKDTVSASTASQTAKATIERAIEKAVSSGDNSAHASVNFRNVQTITPDAFKAIVSTMNTASDEVDVNVTVQLDTIVNDAVAARLYVDPQAAAKLDAPIVATVDTSEKSVTNTAVSKLFDKYFENDVKVVTFGHKGEFGMPVTVAVKVDLTKFNTENLMFYHYDIATNSYSLIEVPEFFIDSAGYVHFTTEKGGSLIITDSALSAK